MRSQLTDSAIHELGRRFDIHVREEAAYILWYIWRDSGKHDDCSLQTCLETLAADDELYAALVSCYALGTFDRIREWATRKTSRTTDDCKVELDITAFLAEIQPSMVKLVRGDVTLPLWTPVRDSLHSEHLAALKIPALKGKPNLLLHDLGRFTTEDVLERRLKNIFMPNNHTFLVNTSGSGKTRLLLEGLCQNWGFYFTSLVDSSLLGSSDVQNSIQTHVPDSPKFRVHLPPAGSPAYDNALRTNREIASRVFRQIFLARLLVFDLFSETVSSQSTPEQDTRVYKWRWLLLQLRPSLAHPHFWDIFDTLACKLCAASDSFINSTTKDLLSRVRTLCSRVDSHSDTTQIPLFCVLDEAQHAATQHSSSFRSDHNGAHRPILREIVRAWEGQSFGQGVFMVVAGTGISKDVVDQAMASAIMKDSRYRWCSDTGAFDDPEVQRHYLEKYLPESYLQSPAGVRLLERAWYWLHGRYRFTAGFLSELILNGFRRPHSLLTAYIQHFTNFQVTDATKLIQDEGSDPLPMFSQYKLDFAKLKKNSEMLSTIQQLTTHYLMRAVLPVNLGKDEATFVEYGFARFIDSDTKRVSVDEPLVLLAATYWINMQYRKSYKYFAKQIQVHTADSNGFENYIAFCIDMLFSQPRRVNEVFTFNGTPPEWTNLQAELVSVHRTDLSCETSVARHYLFSGPSVTLGTNAKSPEETLDWLGLSSHAPICFPHVAMGPDLLFVLRLSDDSLIWVALQAKYSLGKNGMLSRHFLRRAMRSVTPSVFFLDRDGNPHSPSSYPNLITDTHELLSALPRRRTDAGTFSVLRVIASFPADTNLKRCLDEDPDTGPGRHPIATLNMSLIKSITKRLSPIDFLQGLQDPLQTSEKRKRIAEGSKRRTKKIKLN